MRRANVLLVMLMAAAPSLATAQSARVIELGITAGTAHHDYRNRYPGEDNFERTLGVRADLRLIRTAVGTIGVSLLFDRYEYNDVGLYCATGFTNDMFCSGTMLALNAPWRVERRGAGLNLQHRLALGVSGSVGVLAGTTERTYTGASPAPEFVNYSSVAKYEWFRGLDGGLSVRWRDLVVGVDGEYGRVPRTDLALNPYYANVSARVAYALPVPHMTRKLFH